MDVPSAIAECLKKEGISSLCRNNEYFRRLINYSTIVESENGVENFLKTSSFEEEWEYLIKMVAKKLNLEENDNLYDKRVIAEIYNKYVNGYVYHVTNSVNAIDIKKNGLLPAGKIDDEIRTVNDIFKKYRCNMALGWYDIDLTSNNGWFYLNYPRYFLDYINSPEWFERFCGGQNYKNRNYQAAKRYIESVIGGCNMTEEERKIVGDFFEKNWKKYENSTPVLVMIPRSEIGAVSSEEDDSKMCNRARILMRYGGSDGNSNMSVSPANLLFVDMSFIHQFDDGTMKKDIDFKER